MNTLSDIVRVVRVTHSKHGRRNDKLTDVKMLKAVVDESGITITAIADKMGCSRGRVYAILAGSECTASEIVTLSNILHLTDRQRDKIFLSEKVT